MSKTIISALEQAAEALQNLLQNQTTLAAIESAANLMSSCLQSGGRIFSCGNGGSHCDAMHFAEELSGRFRDNRKPLSALAISDPAHITCTGNDFGFEEIFSRFVLAHGRRGDLLLAISTSGTSKNILKAVGAAQSLGMKVVGMTGRSDSPLSQLVDVGIVTPAGKYADRVQELHIKVIHIFIELIERKLTPENYHL